MARVRTGKKIVRLFFNQQFQNKYVRLFSNKKTSPSDYTDYAEYDHSRSRKPISNFRSIRYTKFDFNVDFSTSSTENFSTTFLASPLEPVIYSSNHVLNPTSLFLRLLRFVLQAPF